MFVDIRNAILSELDQMTRFRTMASGNMASSPIFHSQARKTRRVTAEPTKRPMTSLEPQPYSAAPNCRARRNMIAAGAKRTKPVRSKRGRMLRRKGSVTGDLGV